MRRATPVRPTLVLAALALTLPVAAPQFLGTASAAPAPSAPASWSALSSAPETAAGAARTVRPERFQRWQLDRSAYAGSLTAARATGSTTVSLPSPDGGLARFTVQPSTVMEAGLAAAHPEIQTWAGRGVDDPAASVRMDLGPLGLHASVRSPAGAWYVDPYYQRDRGVYLSYYGRDLTENVHGAFVERDGGDALAQAQAALEDAGVSAPPPPPAEVDSTGRARVGDVLRTYRLALLSDPTYASFFGTENVTAAKVALINRVNQIYEDDLAMRLVLISDTDKLNLDTERKVYGANGPCGPQPCFPSSPKPALRQCTIEGLLANDTALGRLVGASAYDVGHQALGNSGGGVAFLGVVGTGNKALGCTGIPQPVGDFYAVDYVAHELGHQFGGNHTYNGCDPGQRNAGTSVEPASGSSIMAYAGICGRDDLQPHSDPYFSQRSFTEITKTAEQKRRAVDEVQSVALAGLGGTDSFALTFRGDRTRTITRGENYTKAGIAAALKALPSIPDDADILVNGYGSYDPSSRIDETGFQVAFRGSLGKVDLPNLAVVQERGATGSVAELDQGGPADNRGATSRTGNTPPVVDVAREHALPLRTPFALTGSATDADGDVLTYLWEQNDPGGQELTTLLDPVKRNGPLFRQFGTPLDAEVYRPGTYGSPGENAATTDPRRVFPNMRQVLLGNTNAATGDCVGPRGDEDEAVPLKVRECYAEFLPTAAYRGLDGTAALHFRLTARDNRFGGGGVASADTTLTLAKGAGPFLVTSQGGGQAYAPGSRQQVRWDVARTDVAPVGVSQVRITMSRDGGRTWPVVLAEATANDGSAAFTVPAGETDRARIRVEAVGNVFFAVNGGTFSVTR